MNESELDLVQQYLPSYDSTKVQKMESIIQQSKQFCNYVSSLHQAINYIIHTRQIAHHEQDLLNRVNEHFRQGKELSDHMESPMVQNFLRDSFVSFSGIPDLKPVSLTVTRESDEVSESASTPRGNIPSSTAASLGSSLISSSADPKSSGGFLRNYLRRNSSRSFSSGKPQALDSSCAALDKELAKLENAAYAHSFSSCSTSLVSVLRLLKPGDEVLVCDDIFEPTFRQLLQAANRVGCYIRLFDISTSILEAIAPTTKMVYVETPSRPLLRVGDIKQLADALRVRGVLLVVDNSMMTSQFQKPMNQGADLVVYTETALLSGRSDLMCGLVFCREKIHSESIALFQSTEGAMLSPFDANLFRAGLKTMSNRLQGQHAAAERIAEYLSFHTLVHHVNYPALRDNKFGKLHKKQSKGNGIVISFQVGTADHAYKLVQSTKIFKTNSRFGSEASFITMPRQRWGSLGREQQLREPPEDLVCISVGSEALPDLIDDLQQALTKMSDTYGPLRSPR
eukprot:TRINITY_DN7069_c0_g1_i1.p1 TRINITY_DN7069_c0_g1~~TRINITY_DN7069_c0_g1_i1.p1  ORF type:complete len:511 (+),score=102.96 TRINITY_DN7069_c0_g1_i1:47-1579(+)